MAQDSTVSEVPWRRISRPHLLGLLLTFGCSTETRSEAGHAFAQHLCAMQDECDCAEDVLIPDCEARVEREFAENERKALHAGLVFDPSCMERFLEFVDDLGACEVTYGDHGLPCAVYGGNNDVGEPCAFFDSFPLMYGCRLDLTCIDGVCVDPDDQIRLPQGAICSEAQHIVPTGDLGECDDDLWCDSVGTRTCVPVIPDPLAALGEACTVPNCLDDAICRPQGDDLEPSEERPGICVERTPPGEPCTVVYECDRSCEDGLCQVPPPVLCEVLGNWLNSRQYF